MHLHMPMHNSIVGRRMADPVGHCCYARQPCPIFGCTYKPEFAQECCTRTLLRNTGFLGLDLPQQCCACACSTTALYAPNPSMHNNSKECSYIHPLFKATFAWTHCWIALWSGRCFCARFAIVHVAESQVGPLTSVC